MREACDPAALLRRHLADPACGFAIGVPAALGEFLRDADEPCRVSADGLAAVTPRGAIRVEWHPAARPIAPEAPQRPKPGRPCLAVCLPEAAAALGGRRALAELGPDRAAVRAEDRTAALFDLGVGAPHVDFCVRPEAPALTALLRTHCGTPAHAWPPEVVDALLAESPPRVVRSRLGRIEVWGPIPRARTPMGPHTHLYPKRFAGGPEPATDAAPGLDAPVPAGWRVCVQVFPPRRSSDMGGRLVDPP